MIGLSVDIVRSCCLIPMKVSPKVNFAKIKGILDPSHLWTLKRFVHFLGTPDNLSFKKYSPLVVD